MNILKFPLLTVTLGLKGNILSGLVEGAGSVKGAIRSH